MIASTRFEQFVCSFKGPLFSFLFRLLQNEHAAEELAQEAFLNLYRSKVDCSNPRNCVEAIYRIAIGLATRAAESRSRVPVNPSPAFDSKEVAICKAIAELPSAQRFAVLLHKYQGLDLEQIGRTLDIDETKVKAVLLAGYQMLRMRLSAYINSERRTE